MTSQEIQAEIANLEATRPELVAHVEALRQQRKSALLSGDKRQLQKLRAEIAAAEGAVEDRQDVLTMLEAQLEKARAEESRAAKARFVANVDRLAKEGFAKAQEAIDLFDRYLACEEEVAARLPIIREGNETARELGLEKIPYPSIVMQGKVPALARDRAAEQRIALRTKELRDAAAA